MKLIIGNLTIPAKRVVPETVRYLSNSLRQLRADLVRAAKAKAYDPELTHRLRVSSRRITSALSLLRHAGYSLRDKELRRQLRQLRRGTGALRDADVRWSHLQAAIPRAAPAGWSFLAGAVRYAQRLAFQDWEQQRVELGRSEIRTADNLKKQLKAIPKNQKPRNVKRLLRWLTDKYTRWKRLVKTAPHNQLHRVRIAGKKLRYLLEAAMPKAKDEKPALLPLRQFQSSLGALRDAQLLQEWLASLAADAPVKEKPPWRSALTTWQRRLQRNLTRARKELQRFQKSHRIS